MSSVGLLISPGIGKIYSLNYLEVVKNQSNGMSRFIQWQIGANILWCNFEIFFSVDNIVLWSQKGGEYQNIQLRLELFGAGDQIYSDDTEKCSKRSSANQLGDYEPRSPGENQRFDLYTFV